MNAIKHGNTEPDTSVISLAVLLPVLSATPSWRRGAVCAQTDPDLFFPDRGGTPRQAIDICHTCEVKTRCLHEALENGEEGVWGATTENQRKKMLRNGGCPCCAPQRKLAS